MRHILIEIEADKRDLKIEKYKDLSDRLESALVWFGMQHIKINIKSKPQEIKK
jgi:hypothetical protein